MPSRLGKPQTSLVCSHCFGNSVLSFLYLVKRTDYLTIMEINKEFLGKLFEQAVENPRLRQSYDLRTSSDDNSQRILNALLPGTVVPIHRHPNSNENVLLLCGKLVEVIYDENGKEKERIHLDLNIGIYGCVIPPGAWHTVEVLEPSVIYEARMEGMEKMGVKHLMLLRQRKRKTKQLLHSPTVLATLKRISSI